MTWIFHHFSTWKKPFIQFASSTSRSRSSSSITFRSWKCAKTASSDMRTRRHGKAETTRMTRMDVGWCWTKPWLQSPPKKSQLVPHPALQAFSTSCFTWKKAKLLPSESTRPRMQAIFWANCGPDSKFLETSQWFLDASSWPTTSESCSAWVQPEAWKAKAAGHQTRQALRTSRKNSEPGIRRLVDTLPVKVSKSRKSYQWLSIEVSVYEFHIQLMFFRPFGPGILRKPHSSPRHSSSAETFWDESRAMEFQLGTGVRRKMSWESLWILMDLLIYPSTGWLASGGRNLRHKRPKKHRSVEVYLIYCIDQTEWSNSSVATSKKSNMICSVANITHLRNRHSDSLHQILQRIWILRSVDKSVEQGKSRDNRALDKRKRFASWETHMYTPCAIRAAFFWTRTQRVRWGSVAGATIARNKKQAETNLMFQSPFTTIEGFALVSRIRELQISGAITSEPLVWAFPCPVQVLQHRDLQP